MTGESNAIAIIIGRAGSKGLPGKNALPLAGQPMICHTIEDAQHATRINRILVSTDGKAIADATRAMGIEVVDRPAALAGDEATVDATVRHAYESSGASHDFVVLLYANVPVRPDDLIDRAVKRLIESGADSVQSYAEVGKHHPCWMVKLDDEGRVKLNIENPIYRRQDLPRLLIPDGGVIALRLESLFRIIEGQPHAFLGDDRRGIETRPGEVIDVDNEADFALAEMTLNRIITDRGNQAPNPETMSTC